MRQAPESVMAQALADVGFDADRPDPSAAWQAFRRFTAAPLVNVITVTVGYECEHDDDRDDVLWLIFSRVLEDAAGVGWSCGCCLSRPVPDPMRSVRESDWWWPEFGTLAQWLDGVERLPFFRACLRLDGWRWAGFSV